jgi:hypothetical protein
VFVHGYVVKYTYKQDETTRGQSKERRDQVSNKTLYIAEHDEDVWAEARVVGEAEGMSVSQLATEALRTVLSSSSGVRSKNAVSRSAAQDDADKDRLKKMLKRLGPQRFFTAFGRASAEAMAEWRDAKRKAEATLGPQGRSSASKAANARIKQKRAAALAARAPANVPHP